MRKEVFKNASAVLRAVTLKNSVSEDTKLVFEQLAAAVEEWANDDTKDYNIEDLRKKFDELTAKVSETEQEVANRIASVRDSIMRELRGAGDAKAILSADACKEIRNAFATCRNKSEVLRAIDEVCAKNGVQVRKTRNDVSGLTYGDILDYAIQIKQDDADELFDMTTKTRVTKIFYAELDGTKPAEIAHQWDKSAQAGVTKDLQSLAVNGKTISTAEVYKMQRVANADLDDAAAVGEESALMSQITNELSKSVKATIVRTMLIGDSVNESGKKITTVESIGTKTTTDAFTTVLAPATANKPTIIDFAKACSQLKAEGKKVCVMTTAMSITLREFVYASGGTPTLISLDQLAALIGVDKVILKDYLPENVHGIFLTPSQYWMNEKRTRDVAFPEWKENAQYFLYEKNIGGAIRGLQSTAVLRENA